jgi:hypothetical protein
MTSFGDMFRKADQRLLAAFDRDLQEFRLSYQEAMAEKERRQVADWLRQLVKLEEECRPWPGVTIKIIVSHDLTDQEGNCHYSGTASLNPGILLQAVEAWERGEEFVPPSGASLV